MKIGWLVGQPAIFHPWFSSGSTVLSRRIQEPLHNYKLLEKMSFIHIIESGILVLSDIRDFYQLTDFFFFRSASEREMGIFSMITSYCHWYYHQLFLLHYHCFSIIIAVCSKVWGRLVCSCSEYCQCWVRFYGDHAIDLRRKLVVWFLVYTSSTWYI